MTTRARENKTQTPKTRAAITRAPVLKQDSFISCSKTIKMMMYRTLEPQLRNQVYVEDLRRASRIQIVCAGVCQGHGAGQGNDVAALHFRARSRGSSRSWQGSGEVEAHPAKKHGFKKRKIPHTHTHTHNAHLREKQNDDRKEANDIQRLRRGAFE